jgi:hypothetical protein
MGRPGRAPRLPDDRARQQPRRASAAPARRDQENAYGSRNEDAARLAARIWTVTATAEMAGLNVLAYLTAYLDECGRNHLRTWAQPPAPG